MKFFLGKPKVLFKLMTSAIQFLQKGISFFVWLKRAEQNRVKKPILLQPLDCVLKEKIYVNVTSAYLSCWFVNGCNLPKTYATSH
jgi:hypothetical protein